MSKERNAERKSLARRHGASKDNFSAKEPKMSQLKMQKEY